jgi:hypothetical protein
MYERLSIIYVLVRVRCTSYYTKCMNGIRFILHMNYMEQTSHNYKIIFHISYKEISVHVNDVRSTMPL